MAPLGGKYVTYLDADFFCLLLELSGHLEKGYNTHFKVIKLLKVRATENSTIA